MLRENQKRLIRGILLLIVVIIPVIILANFAQSPTNVDLLSKANAEFELAVNGNFLIFWAVLLFTCLVGLIELFQLIDKKDNTRVKILYFVLFYILIIGIIASISRSLAIIRENYEIMIGAQFDEGYRTYILNNQSIFDNEIIRNKYFEVLPNLILAVILSVIFAFKIGFWSKKEEDDLIQPQELPKEPEPPKQSGKEQKVDLSKNPQILEQYKQVQENQRSLVGLLWEIPTIGIAISSAFLVAAYNLFGNPTPENFLIRAGLLFFGFLLMFVVFLAVVKHRFFRGVLLEFLEESLEPTLALSNVPMHTDPAKMTNLFRKTNWFFKFFISRRTEEWLAYVLFLMSSVFLILSFINILQFCGMVVI